MVWFQINFVLCMFWFGFGTQPIDSRSHDQQDGDPIEFNSSLE
jgi:hypothetical protein